LNAGIPDQQLAVPARITAGTNLKIQKVLIARMTLSR
jgi:hypothetical protein